MPPNHETRAGDASNARELSWAKATAEAQLVIERKNLRNADLVLAPIKLEELFAGHESEGRWRLMLYTAADRILRKRGATTNLNEFDRSHTRQAEQ